LIKHSRAVDTKVATWRQLHEKAENLHAELMAYARANPLPNGTYQHGQLVIPSAIALEHIRRELGIAEAREKAAVAEYDAAHALDACELAEGLEDARARDLATLRTDLVDLFAEADRLQSALNAARNRIHERVQSAQRAEGATAQRRQEASLPFVGSGFTPTPNTSYLAAIEGALRQAGVPFDASSFSPNPPSQLDGIEGAMTRGTAVPKHYALTVANLRDDLKRVAAACEEARIAKQEREKEAAREKVFREQAIRDEQRRQHERDRERSEAAAADERRRDALANAYLSRQDGDA
jgi:hypothetical protein